jgi:hypothetical protein
VLGHDLACVPSVIDAYMQRIFHPTRDSASPPHGITIDLSLYPRVLFPGTDEFLLPAVGVEIIDVYPVNADDTYREGKHSVNSEGDLFSAMLMDYYKNL